MAPEDRPQDDLPIDREEFDFNRGVEAFRVRAIEIVSSWHHAKWAQDWDKKPMSKEDIHLLLNAIDGDLNIATVPYKGR